MKVSKVYEVDTIGIDKNGFVTGYKDGGFIEAGQIIRIDNLFPDMKDPAAFHGLEIIVSVCKMYGLMYTAAFRIDLKDLDAIQFLKHSYDYTNPDSIDAMECHKAILALAKMYRMDLGIDVDDSIIKLYDEIIHLNDFDVYMA